MMNRLILPLLLVILATASGCINDNSQANGTTDLGVELNGIQKKRIPKGTLIIIGGGPRPATIMRDMVGRAEKDGAYALVFAQSSSEPDTSFLYLLEDLTPHSSMSVTQVKNGQLRTSLVDSVRQASLIFISGGDQNRFIAEVHPAVRKAIREAYEEGAVVAGTSAGAALMSKVMITGDQRDWPAYEPTYKHLRYGNGIYAEGLGLLDSVIVDQHFVARSRYNRLISALADTGFPYAVGVDEATAFVVTPGYCTVVGESQVVVMHHPVEFTARGRQVGLRQMEMNIYLEGDTFKLNE